MLLMMARQSQCNLFVVTLCLFAGCASSQYKPYQNQMRQPIPPSCSESNKNVLVEHFFNLIFSEFQNNPPICVCVQMCINQPTYCYPNGCLRKPEEMVTTQTPRTTTSAPTLLYQVQKDETLPKSFIVHDQSEFMSNLLDRNYVADKHSGRRYTAEESSLLPFKGRKDLRPDPLTDSYKSMFKYKKIPKVHLRYNLREQVKNTKSDMVKIEKIDVTKTRWPAQKRSNFFLERPNDETPDDTLNVKVSPSMALESGQAVLPTKFFKRHISKTRNIDEERDTEDNTLTFLLENLVDSLITKGMGNLSKNTELDLNVNVDYTISNVTTELPEINDTNFPHIIENNDNFDLNVLSEDLKNESIDKNKYIGEDTKEMYRNVYNEMIATIAKNIDKQYNSSIQMMERFVGNTEVNENASYITTEPAIDIIKDVANTTNLYNQNHLTAEENCSPKMSSITKREITRKKSKQRINRKLKNSKLN